MNEIKAWIVIDNDDGKPLLVSDKIPVFWLKKRAELYSKKNSQTTVCRCIIKM